ncbi:hypothetical protein HPB48_021573 [Haemaphysalis longicornis]|uniref:Uncharacterized protein n=1 Tax=Haemaphysalis longicornis TaxID=44386 RepID=A0A9J6FN68_HAELO|nr:hypothetical protein HPB48_021573 [Haemaphysalis longicornis]
MVPTRITARITGVQTGHCISALWKCDNDPNCKGAATCKGQPTYATGLFACNPEHEAKDVKCVPTRWQCDGEKDCASGLDEENTLAVSGDFTSPEEAMNAKGSVHEEIRRHCSLPPPTCHTTSEDPGVSFQQVLDVKSKATATGRKLTIPSREKPGSDNRRRRTVKYDGFTLCALRNIVHDLFLRNEHPLLQRGLQKNFKGVSFSPAFEHGSFAAF